MKRISNSLFEAIRTVTSGPVIAESKEQIQEKGPNDGNLANNAKPYDKVTKGDVIAGRLGKDEMGGKKKIKEELEKEGLEFTEEEVDAIAEEFITERDEGKPGKMFKVIAAKAAKKYGSKEAGNRVAGSIRKKILANEETETVEEAKMAPVPATKPAAKGNSPFNWKGTPRETKDKGELTGHTAKKISTGTVYTKKAVKEENMPMAKKMRKKAMQESIAQTVVKYNDFTLEVTDNPTYSDYLKALQVMIPTNEETAQQEIINLASEAYQGQVQSIIIESMTRQKFSTILDEQRASGAKILDENYIVDSGESYVEYVVEKDGTRTQYIHCGNIIKS
jgi:hypothetical protein